MNKKNNNQLINYLTIENLKNGLLGKAITMSKGPQLEEFFNYFIQLKKNGGDALVNFKKNLHYLILKRVKAIE